MTYLHQKHGLYTQLPYKLDTPLYELLMPNISVMQRCLVIPLLSHNIQSLAANKALLIDMFFFNAKLTLVNRTVCSLKNTVYDRQV